ncbi:MAG: PAS domain S-box protein [Elusimicrobia bacterium]|nr:PAS domain S-box protein [Candidatus Liberimonas magnetica]
MDNGIEKDRISGIIETIMKVERGDYSVQIKLSGRNDDLDSLAMGINMMIDDIKNYVEEIKGYSKTLEQKVEERTRELKESEAKFRCIFENAMDGILVADPQTQKFLMGNNMICKMTGYDLEEIKTLGVVDIHPEKDMPYVVEQFKELARTERILAENIPIKRKDGNVIYADISSSPVTINGKTYLIGIFRDITARKQAEVEKNKLQTQLIHSEKIGVIGQLAGGVAHEMNNPVGVILGFAQVLANDIKEDNPLYMPLKSIEREAQRCKKLVGDLLIFSRAEKTGKETVDINKTIEQTIPLIEAQAKLNKIEITKEYGSNLPFIQVNKNQLQQVIIDLCANAMRSMPETGKISIATRQTETHIEIALADTGMGMTEETKKHIFEPFSKTAATVKSIGLSLSLSFEIIQKHNGTIEVESEVGKGTTFIIKLPKT